MWNSDLSDRRLIMKTILMCRPVYYDVDYDINPWMTNNKNTVDKELAHVQWENLYEALTKVFNVKLITAVQNLPDMVFTANAGFYKKRHNLVYVSNFKNRERKGEEIHFIQWFMKNGYSVFQPNVSFEGEGDLLKGDSHNHWFGHGFRSDRSVKNVFPFTEISNSRHLEMIDPRFYHLDTCFIPLRNGGNLWYPGAFTEESQEKIRRNSFNSYSVEVTEEEALTFCCNAIVKDNYVFMPKCDSVAKKLLKKGFIVKQFEMSEFMKSGGACKCLVMYI